VFVTLLTAVLFKAKIPVIIVERRDKKLRGLLCLPENTSAKWLDLNPHMPVMRNAPGGLWLLADCSGRDDDALSEINKLTIKIPAFFVICVSSNAAAQPSLQVTRQFPLWHMKPPPLYEILLMQVLILIFALFLTFHRRHLQTSYGPFDEKTIEEFVHKFWPVPRLLFVHCDRLAWSSEEEKLSSSLRHTMSTTIQHAVETLKDCFPYADVTEFIARTAEVGARTPDQRIFLTIPGKTRQDRNFDIPGVSVREELRRIFKRRTSEERLSLYRLFSKHPTTKSLAATFLEDYLHKTLCIGAPLLLHEMTKKRGPKNNIYKGPQVSSSTPSDSTIKVAATSRQEHDVIAPPSNKQQWTQNFKDGPYYRPSSETNAVFDSLILHSPPSSSTTSSSTKPVALLFQATVSPRRTVSGKRAIHNEKTTSAFLRANFSGVYYVYVHDGNVAPQVSIDREEEIYLGAYQAVIDDAFLIAHKLDKL
jgi:hypothetical protein